MTVGVRTARSTTPGGLTTACCAWWPRTQCALLFLLSLSTMRELWAAPDKLLHSRAQAPERKWADKRPTHHLATRLERYRLGAFSFTDDKPAWPHSIRHTQWAIAFAPVPSGTGRPLVYSFGSTLVQSAGHSWNISVRYMEINPSGAANKDHAVSAIPRDLAHIQLSHDRLTPLGRFRDGFDLGEAEVLATGQSFTDVTGFVQWTME